MENIKTLLQKVQHLIALDKQRKEEARKRGEKYNIFSVLGLETSEVRTHSAFLASLLNPDGNHGVGCAFLKAFVSDMNLNELQLDTNNSQVTVEHVTGDGRIDILISDHNKKAIIIENKIYAGDQHEQLKRYDDYAKQQFTNGYRLLYLTLDGHKPSEDSTKGLKDNQYFRLAYNNNLNISDENPSDSNSDSNNVICQDIIHWLEECVKIAYNKPLVRETIIQYQSLIKSLTGADMEKEESDNLIELLTSKENVETTLKIIENSGNIKDGIRKLFVLDIQKECNQLGLECIYDEGIIFANHNSWITITDPKHKGLQFKIGVIKHIKQDGFRLCFTSPSSNYEAKEKFWEQGNEPSDEFPLGWIYLWSKTGEPDSGEWWKWDKWDTLRDMANGEMLSFIKGQLTKIIEQKFFERFASET